MKLSYAIYYGILDLVKVGPKFFLQGLRTHKPDSSIKTVDVPGVGPVYVRSGDSDFETVRQVFRGNEYALVIDEVNRRVRDRYRQIIASGKRPVIIDAGANIGAASLWFSHAFPEATIVAIEPDAQNAKILERNARGRPIVVLDVAAGSTEGFVQVHNDGASWGAQTQRASGGVQVVTMATALDKVPDGELFIAKVDIEGFESDLFAENTGWIDQAFAIYVEPHDWLFPGKRTSASFQRAMAEREFEIFINRENLIYVRT